jgi:hypothetical protein
MKTNRVLVGPIAGMLLVAATLSTGVTRAVDVQKADNATALNLAGSWVAGPPTSLDIAVWGPTVTASRTAALGANATWEGIKFNGAVGRQIIGNSAGATLQLGASGIDFTGAAAGSDMSIQSPVTLLANQTWNVTNSNTTAVGGVGGQGDDLFFSASAAGVPLNLGGNTVVVQGGGNIGIGAGFAVSNGSFTVNAGQLFLSSNGSKSSTSSAAVTVNTGATYKLIASSASTTGNAVEHSGSIAFHCRERDPKPESQLRDWHRRVDYHHFREYCGHRRPHARSRADQRPDLHHQWCDFR